MLETTHLANCRNRSNLGLTPIPWASRYWEITREGPKRGLSVKWNEAPMNSPLPASGPAQHRNWTRRLVNVLVTLAVMAVAAATFVFSYDGVHAIALLGGVSTQLARYYPGLFDAVLVIACVAAVMLRDGPWWARLWAWVVLIVVLAATGTTDVLHAMNYTLRHRATEGIVAAAPVVAVLLAFSLLLTLLRQSRTHAHGLTGPAPHDVPALTAAIAVPPIALPAAPATASPSASASAPTESFPVLEETQPGDVRRLARTRSSLKRRKSLMPGKCPPGERRPWRCRSRRSGR